MIGIALVLTHGTFCDGGDHGFNRMFQSVASRAPAEKIAQLLNVAGNFKPPAGSFAPFNGHCALECRA